MSSLFVSTHICWIFVCLLLHLFIIICQLGCNVYFSGRNNLLASQCWGLQSSCGIYCDNSCNACVSVFCNTLAIIFSLNVTFRSAEVLSSSSSYYAFFGILIPAGWCYFVSSVILSRVQIMPYWLGDNIYDRKVEVFTTVVLNVLIVFGLLQTWLLPCCNNVIFFKENHET